jgi:putative endopeptidase
MFGLLGDPAPAARRHAQAVLRLETRLARASMTRTQTDDPIATYHKMTPRELARQAVGFEWDRYLQRWG